MDYKERRKSIFQGDYSLDINTYFSRADDLEPEYLTAETVRDGPLPEGRILLTGHSKDKTFLVESS